MCILKLLNWFVHHSLRKEVVLHKSGEVPLFFLGGIYLEKVLIVSANKSSVDYFTDMLSANSITDISVATLCRSARKMVAEDKFDLVIINSPLKDESGERLSIDIAQNEMVQVILVVNKEYADEVAKITETDGIYIVEKPINKSVFNAVLKIAFSSYVRLNKIREQNEKLKQEIKDIKMIDRAKCILISALKMNEKEAHRYIEKHAMDMRQSKREVAEGILKTYEY